MTNSFLIKSASLLFVKNTIIIINTITVAIFAANILDPAVYGVYKYLIAIGALASVISLSGAKKTMVRESAKGNDGALTFLFNKSIFWGYIGSLSLLILSFYYFFQNNTGFAISLFVIAILQPLYQSFEIGISYIGGKELYKKLAYISVLLSIFSSVSLICVMYLSNSYLMLIFFFLLANTILYGSVYLYSQSLVNCKLVKNVIEVYRNAKHLSIMNVSSKVSAELIPIITFHLLGAVELAIFSFAATPVSQLRGQRKIFSTLAGPRYSRYSEATIRQGITRKAIIILLFSTVVMFLYIISAPFIFNLLFPKYLDSILITQLLSISLLSGPGIVYIEALTVHNKTKALYIINTFSPLLRIFLLITLVPIFGLFGLTIAVVVSQLLNMFIAIALFYRYIN